MSERLTELTKITSVDDTASFYVVDPTLVTDEKRRRIEKSDLKEDLKTNASGNDTEIQFNDSGVFNGSSNFVWDKINEFLGIGFSSPQKTLDVIGDFRIRDVVNDTSGRPVSILLQSQVVPSSLPVSLVDYHLVDVVGIIEGDNTSGTSTSLYSHQSTTRNVATNDVKRLVSYYGLSENNSTSNVDQSVCLQIFNKNNSTGSINEAIGVLIFEPDNSGGGNITDAYGIYIENFTTASGQNYGIYSLANNYFKKIEVENVVNLGSYTVSALPTGNVGDLAYVTDGSTVSYRGVATGGGSETVLVFYDGTNWIYH